MASTLFSSGQYVAFFGPFVLSPPPSPPGQRIGQIQVLPVLEWPSGGGWPCHGGLIFLLFVEQQSFAFAPGSHTVARKVEQSLVLFDSGDFLQWNTKWGVGLVFS